MTTATDEQPQGLFFKDSAPWIEQERPGLTMQQRELVVWGMNKGKKEGAQEAIAELERYFLEDNTWLPDCHPDVANEIRLHMRQWAAK